jgi:hypothetical protein
MRELKPGFIIFFLILLSFAGYSQPTDHLIDSIIHMISPTTYRIHFDSLRVSEGCTRKVYNTQKQSADHDACRDYIFRIFKKYLGDENVYLHHFKVEGNEGLANVIAFKQGKSSSNEILILSAHFDSNNGREESDSEPKCSPGANDNGTGVAAILEMARVLSRVETEKSILFAAWDFEEQFPDGFAGGSNCWYSEHVNRKKQNDWDKIKDGGKIKFDQLTATINFDMFGHPNDTINGKLALWACSGNVIHYGFVNDYISTINRYIPEIAVVNYGKLTYSDHYTFAARKIPSVENLESGYDNDPFYHTCSDNLENVQNINFDFAVNVTRGGMAFALEKAGIVSPLIEKSVALKIPIIVFELPNEYCIKLPSDDVIVQIIDQFGNHVITYKQGDFLSFYPVTSGLFKFFIFNNEGRSSQNLFFKKKEGRLASFL